MTPIVYHQMNHRAPLDQMLLTRKIIASSKQLMTMKIIDSNNISIAYSPIPLNPDYSHASTDHVQTPHTCIVQTNHSPTNVMKTVGEKEKKVAVRQL
mmetsp:Transcript_6077/g.6981  ORF Transcript_6077/g.6981 Transcript_6077/m.6981 type:complete len:97 (+) Transcript_6077:194-484(+)